MGRPVILGKYPYTYLRTIIMKKQLLARGDYDKLLRMGPAEIGKYLEDFEYKKEVDELGIEYSGVELVERALQKNLGSKFSRLLSMAPHDLRLLIKIYQRRYDIHNIKTIIRAKFSAMSADEARSHLLPTAIESPEYFERLIAQKSAEDVISSLSFLPENDLRAALEHYRENKSLTVMENVLDKHYFAHVFSQLRYLTMEGRMYKRFLLNEIDVGNVKLILRLKSEGIPEQAIRELIFSTGMIKRETLERMIKSDAAGIIKALEATDFRGAVEKYGKEPEQADSIGLEISLDKFLLEQSRKLIRQHPMSVDVILGYMFLKDIEVKNLMRIIKGKQLQVPDEFIERTVVI